MSAASPLKVFVVAGEESGDQLGAKLMVALRERLGRSHVGFAGVGGEAMAREGLASLFPLADIAVMGVSAVLARLPTILRRISDTVSGVVSSAPDVLVIIDSPDFTHRVARRVRRRLPRLPIVDYVSPSVWAWRPGRAAKMRGYVDHVLALLPFEPGAHQRLGGPPCTYVGHPLVERLVKLRPAPGERPSIGEGPPTLLVLPGSRRSEIARLMEPFGEALARASAAGPFRLVLPAVSHLAAEIEDCTRGWPLKPDIILGEDAKLKAFRSGHAALAASGTVTLELALSGVPMVVAYKVSKLEEQLRFFIHAHSVVLPNLILGENAIPELLQWDCTPEKLGAALIPLLSNTATRAAQLQALARLDGLMLTKSETPSQRAASIVIELAARKRSA
jgi:lipid-A-disaccharide synthase